MNAKLDIKVRIKFAYQRAKELSKQLKDPSRRELKINPGGN